MVSCPSCGKEVSPQAVACPNCGHALQTQAVQQPSKPTGVTSPKYLAYYSIICGVASLLVLALPLGVIGSILGVFAIRRGEVRLGSVGLALSLVFGIVFALINIFA